MLNKFLFLIIIFSLSACGGGSGGDDNNSSNYRDARQVGSASTSADYIFTDYDNGGIYDSADYQNSDFIMMKVEGAGKLQIEITPDDYSLDIDCGLTSSVGPSDEFYANNFIYDDNGFEIIENSYSSTCSLSADFSDDREFYLFIDIADGLVTSGYYTVTYSFTPTPEYIFTGYNNGSIYDSADYQNSDFIMMKVEGAGKLQIEITPDDYSLDIDCGLTSSVGPSDEFYANNFIYDDNGFEIIENSYSSTCSLSADFSDDREFYLFIDIADGLVTSGYYTVTYSFTPTPEYIFTGYNNGSIYDSADYQNSDFIMMKVEGAGKLQIEITPDDYSLDIDCGLTSSVGPSDEFYANNFIYDDNGFEIIENSYSSTCSLSADFYDDREFYLFIDIADGQVTSGSYNVTYRFTPEYIDDSYDAIGSADYIFTDYDNGGIFYGSADYQNSDFIKMKVEGAGKLQIEITPDDYSLDIDCGLTYSVGPSNFYDNNFIYDDNGFEIIENSYSSTCSLSADFSDDREFYLFIDIADGQVTSGSYTVTYSFIPEYIAYSYDAIGSDG